MIEYNLDNHICMGGWFMPEKLCDNIIEFYNLHKSKSGRGESYSNIYGKAKSIVDENIKDSYDLSINHFYGEPPFEEYRILLQKCLENYIEKYDDVNSLKKFNINEPYNIQYYKPNGGYKIWHFENAGRTDRVFAFMTYLNDVDDGGTEFKYQNLITPARKGLTLIWPANWTHTHRGQVSKTKEKYIVTGWYSINEFHKKEN